jgi:chitin synthase
LDLTASDASQLDGMSRSLTSDGYLGACPFPLGDVVPQPPTDFQPFNYPLAHTILLVTAYSESVEGLRTTLDSLATTDYPNSHKVILVIADGMVKGSGNNLSTPEIVLGMMKELVIPSEDVEALSYVAIADGHKRHNMAKIYAGFYEYDNNTVEMSKQQRVPMMLVAKVGNPSEASDAKPGNRGKRDSQIVLMSFLQKVMFDERMTTLEYEFFNSMWRCTGVSPDRFEMVLCVDADTKIFPDSVSRMVSCMVHDPEIMGLCGETKIANKSETWVTMIQGEFCDVVFLSSARADISPLPFPQSSSTMSLIISPRRSSRCLAASPASPDASRCTESKRRREATATGFPFSPTPTSSSITRRTSSTRCTRRTSSFSARIAT